MLCLPYSEFLNYYDHKTLGEILLGFQKIGYDFEILVGEMKSEMCRKTGIKIFETGNLDADYIVDSKSMKIMPRLKNLWISRNINRH